MDETTAAPVPVMYFDAALYWMSLGMEVAGVAVILLGALVAIAALLVRTARSGWDGASYDQFRTTLARGILLGLEFLIAADIIGTVAVEPTLQNLSVLALIIVIRTFLSFSLEVEIDGRWPWRKGTPPRPEDGD